MRTHIVWDWNGTLLSDMAAVVGASNAAFATVGLAPITLEEYRAHYEIPIPRFYERLMGRVPTAGEWTVLDDAFDAKYSELFPDCGLTPGVEGLLAGWNEAGRSQSVLSMYGHDKLVPAVDAFGITRYFTRVDGRRGESGGRKAGHLALHLDALGAGIDRGRTVLIGDAADDAEAALSSGIKSVLYTGGSHTREKLVHLGVPVVDSLAEAVAVAEELTR
ncbi:MULTISPECIES: HAD hydrolase-like protein [Kitasatospora]|uniref:Putative hydrolase n=1 Tax=Kitasatospora setae (strain ATCC 33774 / DSM 43861 / JCM 3304 / KCC A-0304 / NBRC 14216 / KM-6054) TaxID=452652 RepID=E4NBX6_KITSK|nr:HAD hydrolase-like protein [Kitasatospora setae]BAJ28707.1 putative hydrolase [Kitasatospora setae KM-6054]